MNITVSLKLGIVVAGLDEDMRVNSAVSARSRRLIDPRPVRSGVDALHPPKTGQMGTSLARHSSATSWMA